jgi:hypothetical protein
MGVHNRQHLPIRQAAAFRSATSFDQFAARGIKSEPMAGPMREPSGYEFPLE